MTRRIAMSYQEALDMVAQNDDTEWLADPEMPASVGASFVAWIYRREVYEMRADLQKVIAKAQAR